MYRPKHSRYNIAIISVAYLMMTQYGGNAENAEHENARHENTGKRHMERQHNFHSKKYCNCKMHCNVDEKRH